MKKLYSLIIAGVLVIPALKSYAQSSSSSNDDGFSQLIKSSPGDATKLLQAYAEPMFKGFGTGLNSGWNNTAATKKLLHFDLRISAAVAQVPTGDQTFDVTKIGLSNNLKPADPNKTIAPTFGNNNDVEGPKMNIMSDNGTTVVSSFTLPKGVFNYVPAPNIQLTIGLVHHTDLTIRTVPKINLGDDAGSVGMIGFGIKHDVIQDFAKKVPKPFDLALAVNYNRINYTKTLNVKPDAGSQPAAGQSSDFSNQRIEAHFGGVNVQAIISKKLLFFTPFLAVAYQTASTDLGVLGNYPIASTNPLAPNQYITVTDPVHINETSVSGMRADLGFQLNLAILRIYASASTGQYISANAGIGFGF
ncbi:hypothetical protein HQ865_04980 [Mucilaginibacter mali]|uniref:Outer membrane protein beta-barrel domain-containing protein n=1 Tax=Mucilaginibacter mali TaxID=2740462 RepID=A0A7D4TMG5_9SPHI|nr:DUF6588 family protein [Mucilaginibacter mali]QKJ29134.1 hypothetical protein HQ865_04980 [Mucilaginibacter mali]